MGTLAGLPLSLRLHVQAIGCVITGITIDIDGVPQRGVHLTVDELDGTDPAGLATRIENRITGLDQLARQLSDDIADTRREADRARAQQGQPFVHADRLATARVAAADLHRQMNELVGTPGRPESPAGLAHVIRPVPPSQPRPTPGARTTSHPHGRPVARPSTRAVLPGDSCFSHVMTMPSGHVAFPPRRSEVP